MRSFVKWAISPVLGDLGQGTRWRLAVAGELRPVVGCVPQRPPNGSERPKDDAQGEDKQPERDHIADSLTEVEVDEHGLDHNVQAANRRGRWEHEGHPSRRRLYAPSSWVGPWG